MPLSFYNSMTTAPYGAHLIESIKSPTLGDYTAQVTHGADTLSQTNNEIAVIAKEVNHPCSLEQVHLNSISQPSQPTQKTLSNQVSHKIIEKPQESHEAFQQKLHFQYLSKNLKPSLRSQQQLKLMSEQAGFSGSQSQQQVSHENFMQTFNPSKEDLEQMQKDKEAILNRESKLDDVYLRDTSQSLLNLENQKQKSIMSNENMGINAKIVNLQQLHQRTSSNE